MLQVVREVLSGQMEWANQEKSAQGVTFRNWARRIEELLAEREKRLIGEAAPKSLHTFKNLAQGRDPR